jgi:hypothetical protein
MKRICVVALSAALVLASAGQATAAHIIQLSDGLGHTATISDVDQDGLVTFSGDLGLWFINVTTGLSAPAVGDSEMQLLSVNVSGGGAGQLTITQTDTDFTQLGSASLLLYSTTSFSLLSPNTISYSAYWDDGNAQFATTSPLGTLSASSTTYSGSLLVNGPSGGGTYSLTQVVTINHNGLLGGTTAFSATVSVPERASILIVGLAVALMGALGVFWRDRTVGSI